MKHEVGDRVFVETVDGGIPEVKNEWGTVVFVDDAKFIRLIYKVEMDERRDMPYWCGDHNFKEDATDGQVKGEANA